MRGGGCVGEEVGGVGRGWEGYEEKGKESTILTTLMRPVKVRKI